MCSIIGCKWPDEVAPMIVKSLQRMEYRGYDSVGAATAKNDQIYVKKGIGKVAEVESQISLSSLEGKIGIGHTRWATHGGVKVENAHPHLSSQKPSIAVVHNGIIDNYLELKQTLKCEFLSETDTEVISQLLGHHYSQTFDAYATMKRVLPMLKGHYAFIALFEDGSIAAARNHEPLILGISPLGYFVASDVLGFIEWTDDAIYLDNHEFIIIPPTSGVEIYTFEGHAVNHRTVKLSKELSDVYKDDYAHFTLKEIHEQPQTILKAGMATKNELKLAAEFIKHAKNFYITGSGTSYNAALVAKHLFRHFGKVNAEPIISSEARFDGHHFDSQSILLALSQSGESADVLDTVNLAKEKGAKIISIVNTMNSSLARLSSINIGLNCGPEIGVAATKSFTSQLAVLMDIANEMLLTSDNYWLNRDEISKAMQEFLKNHKIQEIAKELKEVQDIYILGRGIHYPIASEASLKLKELAYIHAEGLPGGELKHGPLALMNENVYVILINPTGETHKDMLGSCKQIKSRNAKIIGISNENHEMYDHWIEIPTVKKDACFPIVEILPVQLLAYYLALEKNADPDYPRNLAKSCTVR